MSTAHVHDIGLEHDRRYMVVGPDNVFLTQRDEPSMATIEVAQVASGWSVRSESNGAIAWEPQSHGTRFTVQIWKDQVEVVDQGETSQNGSQTHSDGRAGSSGLRHRCGDS